MSDFLVNMIGNLNPRRETEVYFRFSRAWVSINNCFILSKEYPGVEKKKSNTNFEKSLTELQTHIDRLKTLYGSFVYAPLQTPLSKTKPFKFVPTIDGKFYFSRSIFSNFQFFTDSILPTYVTVVNNNSNTLRSSVKCTTQPCSPLPQQSNESNNNMKTTIKRSSENSDDQQESVKRVRLSSRPSDDNSINSNRIVLRIRKPSEDLSSSRSETSNHSNNQLTIQIKDPLEIVREDEEQEEESQSSNVFDIINEASNKDDE